VATARFLNRFQSSTETLELVMNTTLIVKLAAKNITRNSTKNIKRKELDRAGSGGNAIRIAFKKEIRKCLTNTCSP
jgi:hypothetical protein